MKAVVEVELIRLIIVQRKSLRALLGLRAGTPSAAVLGEAGRFPVAHTAATLLCRFLDLDLDLVTYCAVNWLTIAQARRQTEMHSGRQRAEV